jgi:hypothetical protein
MTIPGYQSYTPTPQRSSGMAVASLVLGLVGLPALLLCGAGMLLGIAGLALGLIALSRGQRTRAAIGGVCASLLTLIVGSVAIVWLLNQAAECADRTKYPDDSARQQCIEREFPFADSSAAVPAR